MKPSRDVADGIAADAAGADVDHFHTVVLSGGFEGGSDHAAEGLIRVVRKALRGRLAQDEPAQSARGLVVFEDAPDETQLAAGARSVLLVEEAVVIAGVLDVEI